jgi:hypothetical protein
MTTPTRTDDLAGTEERAEAAVAWLEAEFPGWTISVDRTATWQGQFRPLWIARSEGHHPQAELTAAKLHTRLVDYLDREQRRDVMRN